MSDGPSPAAKLDQSFRKTDRILGRDVFRRVYDQGTKYQGKYFVAFVLANSGLAPRLGITATRKTGKSVRRNRSRRLVREVFRKNKWRVPPAVDIVVNVKGVLADASYDELEADFLKFLERIK